MEEFEFDPAKSAANRDKHGIDFVEAQALWKVPAWEQPSAFLNEERRLRIGKLDGRAWTAVYTTRNAVVRIISVRRARKEEIASYGRSIGKGTGTDHEP